MLQSFVFFIVKFIFECMVFLFLLRFVLQIYKAPYHHPMIVLLRNITDTFIIPTRKLLPNTVKYDYACILVSACVLLIKYVFLLFTVKAVVSPLWIFAWIGLDIVRIFINIHMYSLILYALASWLPLRNDPSSPYVVISLISSRCMNLLKPKIWKGFDLRVIILIGAGSILSSLCTAFSIF